MSRLGVEAKVHYGFEGSVAAGGFSRVGRPFPKGGGEGFWKDT
jgi:hypothetical protein